MAPVGPVGVAEIIGAVIATLTVAAAVFVWLIRNSSLVATEPHVSEQIDELQGELDEARSHARENRRELEELQDLLEGGNSKFDKGVFDYLQDNIDRVDQISEDIDDIQSSLDEIKRDSRKDE